LSWQDGILTKNRLDGRINISPKIIAEWRFEKVHEEERKPYHDMGIKICDKGDPRNNHQKRQDKKAGLLDCKWWNGITSDRENWVVAHNYGLEIIKMSAGGMRLLLYRQHGQTSGED